MATNKVLKQLISEMVESYLSEEGKKYDDYTSHAAVVHLPDGNHAIIGVSTYSFGGAVSHARNKGLLDMHKDKPVEHYRITKYGHKAFNRVGYDHDEKKSYDHNKWKFDHENKTIRHSTE